MVKSIATTVILSFENNFVFRTIFDKIPFLSTATEDTVSNTACYF